MKVVLDVRPVTQSPAGIGQYVSCLARALHALKDGPELILFGDRETDAGRLPDLKLYRMPSGLVWHEIARTAFRKTGAPVYHSPSSAIVPMSLRGRSVITVHDLVPLIFPETSTWRTRLGYRLLRRAIRHAGAVIAVSENTRADLERVWGLTRHIDVVHEAARDLPPPGPDSDLDSLGVKPPYILCVGTLEPRKNLTTLISAYASLQAEAPGLVVVGASGWGGAPAALQKALRPARSRVQTLGYRTDAELSTLYTHACAFVLPSLYEGFGLPALEAMAAGTPVVAAGAGSLPEVLGDAAAYFDPQDAHGLAKILARLATDASYRHSLVDKGVARAAEFSWKRAARETFAIYQNVAKRAS